MIPTWIVYLTPDDKVEAVQYDFTCDHIARLESEGCTPVGTPVFKDKLDAINYAKQRWL